MKILVSLGAVTFALISCLQSNCWKDIVVFKSNRADVEQRLGPHKEMRHAQYDLEDALVNIDYAEGPCGGERTSGWNVPRDVVVGISVYPKAVVHLADLGIAEDKFTKVKDPHMPGEYFHMVNHEEGLTIVVTNGAVKRYEYWPPSRFKDLSCAIINKK